MSGYQNTKLGEKHLELLIKSSLVHCGVSWESQGISILKINENFRQLKSCLESWSQDVTGVISGEAILYNFSKRSDL